MPTAKNKRIAALEKAADSIARRGRRPGQFTLDGFCCLLVELCGTDARELVEAVFDRRPLPGRERLSEAVRRALCAVLSGERAGYREACAEIRVAAEAERPERQIAAPPVEVARPTEVEPVAPVAAVGEKLIAEIESLPDAVLSDSDVEEVRRRLPGEGPVRIPGDPPDMHGWRPLGDGDGW